MRANLLSKLSCVMIAAMMTSAVNAASDGEKKHVVKTYDKGVLSLQGAYYGKVNSGESWESVSRTGPYADVAVCFEDPKLRLVFWRGSSYLP